jgi:hypothetical protein
VGLARHVRPSPSDRRARATRNSCCELVTVWPSAPAIMRPQRCGDQPAALPVIQIPLPRIAKPFSGWVAVQWGRTVHA